MGEDHVLSINLGVKLVIPFIFTDIQGVKTWLFDKTIGVCFVWRWCVYFVIDFLIMSG